VPALQFGQGFAQQYFSKTWKTARCIGKVLAIVTKRRRDQDVIMSFKCQFMEDSTSSSVFQLKPSVIQFESKLEPEGYRTPKYELAEADEEDSEFSAGSDFDSETEGM
jgi:hypothetical protein